MWRREGRDDRRSDSAQGVGASNIQLSGPLPGSIQQSSAWDPPVGVDRSIPDAEKAVGRFRASLDRAASWRVPSHITVLYPFVPPQRIHSNVLAALSDVVAAVPRFSGALAHVDWFADTVVWPARRPGQPFRHLSAAVWQRFPEAPPYAGQHEELIPHLTIPHDAAPATAGARGDSRDRASAHQVHRGQGPADQWGSGSQLVVDRPRVPSRRAVAPACRGVRRSA